MKLKLLNQRNLTRRLKRLSVLFALTLVSLGVWAQEQIYYPINVGGVPVTSENYMGITGGNIEGMVRYDDQSATLTLEGATILSGGIEYLASGELTLVITGDCSIRGNILSTGSSTLTLQLNDVEDPGSLIYKPSNGDASGFTKIVYHGMYLSEENARDVKYCPTRQRFDRWDPDEEEYVYSPEVKFSSAQTYELWLGSTKVTEANKNNILGGETVTATFNPNDSTLTLNDMNLVATGIDDSGIISRLEKLTIIIVGNNPITTSDSCTAIRADMEGEQKLIIEKGGDDCSLVLNAPHAIHDFSTLTLTDLFWNDRFTYVFDETLSGYPSGYRLMLSDGIEAKKDDNTGFKPTLSDTEEYGIIVTTDVTGPISVTNKNRTNVLNDAVTDATVQFDGLHTLILNNANLNGIYSFFDGDLTIELKGSSTITADVPCIQNEYNGKNISFTRGDAKNLCSLTLSCEETNVIEGFSNSADPTLTGLSWFPTIDDNETIISATITTLLIGGGEGTEKSPYLIKTYDHLKEFATHVNDGTLCGAGTYIRLDADIDCDGKTDFVPIGTASNPFKGYFNGNGKTISNLSCISTENTDFAGLFGKVESSDVDNTTIRNLTLSNCTFKGGNMTGAIAANLSKGIISDCDVSSCTLETGNPRNPECGGIAGHLDQGKILLCKVNGGSISAVTTYNEAAGVSYAGGIVGKCYKYNGNEIRSCTVVDNATITSSHAKASSALYAGAIIGDTMDGDGSELSLTNNQYFSVVTTSTKRGTDEAVVKSGQTERGIGSGHDVIGQVELAGTKKVKVLVPDMVGNDGCSAVVATYYKFVEPNYYVLSGSNFTYSMKPTNGYKPAFTLSDDAIEVTANEVKKDGVYVRTDFTFPMPDADLEATLSFPIDLAAISDDNFAIDYANYTGSAIVPTTVKVLGIPGATGVTELTKDTDFTVKGYKLNGQSVTSPVDIGTYTVTIEGTGNYIGTKDVSYSILMAYNLWINDIQFTELNSDNFYSDVSASVKFTPATETNPTNTLTLNSATIDGVIKSGLDNLTIYLSLSNKITGSGSSLITSLNGGTLTFDSGGTEVSTLEFKDDSGNAFPNNPISGFSKVEYGTWLEYDESFKKVRSWDIEILKGERVTRINNDNKNDILGDGSVSFSYDSTNGHVITLNNAEIDYIWTDIHADITIALNGTNKAINTGGTYAIYSNNGDINFVKAEGSESAELEAQAGSNIAISSYTVGNGLYTKPISEIHTIITSDPEFIIVNGYAMTDGQVIGVSESSITFNATDKTLTFKEYHGALTSQITTGLTGLTVKMEGTSSVSADALDYLFKALTNTATIVFDGSDGGRLHVATKKSDGLFEGFAEGAITYNKVTYWYDSSAGNHIHRIEAPTIPTMELDANEKVTLTKPYADGTIYYSIDYADETEDETKVTYSDPFALTHPATVTTWAEANNATTNTVTVKYFAYKDAPFTMAINGTETPTLLPAIAEGDVIALSGYTSTDGDIATFADGLITAKKPGTVTLSVTLTPGDKTPFKILNPVPDSNAPNEYAVTFKVYVGEPLGNYFEGCNEYGTFYNETGDTYAVPQGMKAYVVTGISGSKLVIEETTVLPPNTVVLLEKAEGISFTKVPASGSAPAGNLLRRATSEVPVTTESCLYVLYNDTYVKASVGSIPAGKNYLDLSTQSGGMNGAGARGVYYIGNGDEDTTGIDGQWSMDNGQSDQWYDLQGRRIYKPTKAGFYIKNGKKMVINNK